MKKVVLKLDLHDDKAKQKAMKMVSSLTGIDSIAMEMKEKKLTVVGDIDPVHVVNKLRKTWQHTEILTVGPAKEPEKKKDEKKDEGKKDDDKKKKEDPYEQQIAEYLRLYRSGFNIPHMSPYYYPVHSVEENPNACAIC